MPIPKSLEAFPVRTNPITTALLAGTTCSLVVPPLAAEVTTAYYHSRSNYGYHIENMPDFDQQRNFLSDSESGVPGGMYCVPTACTNLLTYLSTHGEPRVGLRFADWEAEEDYLLTTTFIAALSTEMWTDGFRGTSFANAFEAMKDRVVSPTDGRFLVGSEYWSPSNVVTLREMARTGIRNDAIQNVHYGRYEVIGELLGTTIIDRQGGHAMTFTGAERSGSYRRLWANDPWSDRAYDTQNRFVANDWDAPWVGNLRPEAWGLRR